MSESSPLDIAIVGGGIVGLSTACALAQRYNGLSIAIFEKEADIAQHQTGHNSGVIHSGIYYRPGSQRARMAVQGSERMVAFCEEHSIPYDRCGKVIVATEVGQVPALVELLRRGQANGVPGVRMIGPEELRELEPYATGIRAIHVPSAGIVNYSLVAQAYRKLLEGAGGEVRTGAEVTAIVEEPNALRLQTTQGDVRSKHVITCGGLYADRVSMAAGLKPEIKVAPFRGEYSELVPEKRYLVRNLIYPVANPAFPFLGVHFTRRINGAIEVGPNAVLAFRRQGYRWRDVSVGDTLDILGYAGFWRMAARYWRTGLGEMYRSLNKRAMVKELQKLVPDVTSRDLVRAGAGVRAQALDRQGKLVEDFHIVQEPRMIHVLNAPSPAATASLSIGSAVADMAEQWLASRS
ncbi:MAG: L-2-hydroxyglutarate oxidase [Chloroflexota bacterium]|nr:L-2-hydroxyglutarate oxidase [Chloroflexota bacterium]MDE2840929.1 L-2-hydroxyglutarate oxidase [Chloroflexota bacterium]MDE2931378.1 L-2-hydroxyglutarate oxidase [Chloroflexota bacterium]